MRLAILGLWIAVIVAALVPLLRRPTVRSSPPLASDELVKDPVCGTYVVRSRAVSRSSADGPRFFCSAECATRFTG